MQKIKELIVPTPVQRSHPTYKQGMNQMFIWNATYTSQTFHK